MLSETFSNLCNPAKLAFIFVCINFAASIYKGMNIVGLGVQLFFDVLWVLFLVWICSKDRFLIAWVIALFPIILIQNNVLQTPR